MASVRNKSLTSATSSSLLLQVILQLHPISWLLEAIQRFEDALKKGITLQDQKWIASTLWGNQRLWSDLKLWYEPPAPDLIYNQAPTPERFFNHRLLMWMSSYQWKVMLLCPECGQQLTGCGIHKRAQEGPGH
ncbi:hypothetical protein SKAU_G00241910 [Synaphobranchus kaupii]|uniref:DUF6729 domain-containing protein n=1 Tax=Synaphobranchus kaupii TaxID=118154 RepID=A0A9Q1F7V2_SYNKA|nr:hypothetical protein SKAU_G00241910 [Synaphobranchus kaupii]